MRPVVVMRNQEISACTGDVSYIDLRHCTGCDVAAGFWRFGKIKHGLPKGRDPQAVPPAAGPQAQTTCGRLNPVEERCAEISILAQPTFVFGKKDRPLKISSVLPKNVQDHHLSLSRSPAQSLTQLSEDNSYSKTAVKSSITMNLSSPKTARIHLLENRSVLSSSNSGFVFGENMVERVLSPEKHSTSCNEADSYKREMKSLYIESLHVTQTAFLRNATLTESAVAHISKPGEKILLDKVEVITGEEEEHNVLQINCKLFLFNKLSLTWTEKGRGSLRLNDTSSNKRGMLQSRLIMRNQGSLRLILNTRLWGQMVIKRANNKSLCFTATDQEDHSVQVFLIQARSKDAGYLYAAIHHRLVALRSCPEQESDANQIDTESETTFQLLNCDSDEDDEKITHMSSSGSDHSRWSRRQPVVCS
ncbi:ran-binding protein 3-like isoform X4 [Numida meleagris]|uniref:ran-binding protein 3-like isoform X4 n=1 Tax=Numida meleagris TaxID=8996 RepID=UPI000B3DA9BC|nr:ran-binding protein 3-like isoform X4 [Numida meleagris]